MRVTRSYLHFESLFVFLHKESGVWIGHKFQITRLRSIVIGLPPIVVIIDHWYFIIPVFLLEDSLFETLECSLFPKTC